MPVISVEIMKATDERQTIKKTHRKEQGWQKL